MQFDTIVIGGGPGGYVAAIRASQLNLKTLLIEKEELGGVCLNWGCIPTKALLKVSETYDHLKHAEELGIKIKGLEFDISKIVKRSREISAKLSGGIKQLMKKNKIEVVKGHARLSSKNEVIIEGSNQKFTAKSIIIATGARSRVLPGLEPDGKSIWTSKEAMIPEFLPKSLLVVGSGAIGIEFASFYNALGSKVTVIEQQAQILPVEDEEISKVARKSFEKKGINFHTGCSLKSFKRVNDIWDIELSDGTKIKAEVILSAVGIVPNTENLGIEALGIKTDRGHISTDAHCMTNVSGIYAIGDVTGAPWLAHKASHEGIIAAESIAGSKHVHAMNKHNIPGCTYSSPQIASVGLTEKACKEKGIEVNVGRFPFSANGKALTMGEDEGLIKIIFDKKTGELLGAHMVGSEVTELIQGLVIAKNLETTEEELKSTIFPHPTLSEMIHEAVLNAYKQSIHI